MDYSYLACIHIRMIYQWNWFTLGQGNLLILNIHLFNFSQIFLHLFILLPSPRGQIFKTSGEYNVVLTESTICFSHLNEATIQGHLVAHLCCWDSRVVICYSVKSHRLTNLNGDGWWPNYCCFVSLWSNLVLDQHKCLPKDKYTLGWPSCAHFLSIWYVLCD